MALTSSEPRVLVSLVTCNDELFLARCLRSIELQSLPVAIRAFDNASTDTTPEILRQHGIPAHFSDVNLGYSAGHNRNLSPLDYDWVLLLNADVILDANYLHRLLGSLASLRSKRIGMGGGKLRRMSADGVPVRGARGFVLDSTGVYFTPTQRHFDRGSQEEDVGQYDERRLVFGITGAALLCRREMLEDLAIAGEFLDESFFAYREDADLAWRAQLRGWSALYEPRATGYHCRQVLPRGRAKVSPVANYHSVKNRFLMRRKNIDWAVRLKCFPWMWIRDLGILLYVLARERPSWAALLEARGMKRRMQHKRQLIQESRIVSPREMAAWFSFRPRTLPHEKARNVDSF